MNAGLSAVIHEPASQHPDIPIMAGCPLLFEQQVAAMLPYNPVYANTAIYRTHPRCRA